MCGIAGIYAYHHAANAVHRKELQCIRDHMAARGPDGSGEWISQDERVGLAHRRLSILDLSERAAQPMVSADGKLAVTFNGEIYNYKEIKARLQAKGRLFRTQTDTEVLLQLYADKGLAMLDELRGMFAFGLWDIEKKVLLLARDPYGIKPVYYSDDGRTFRFASQVKALLAGGRISKHLEPAGLVGFYLFGSVPEPFTTYEKVRALPAGTMLWVNRTGPHEPKQYFSISDVYCRAEAEGVRSDRDNIQVQVQEALLDSVRHHLISDVPVGAFLSGGVDSGALLGLMCDAGASDVQTVTLAFEEFRDTRDDEAPFARQLALRYGSNHHTRTVTEQEFHEDLPNILRSMDQPTIDGINSWFISKAARELGLKVAISGLGGDELFGGYPSFRDVPRWVRLLSIPSQIPRLAELARHTVTIVNRFCSIANPKAASLLKYGGTYAGAYLLRRGIFMPSELTHVIDEEIAHLGLERLKPLIHIETALRPEPTSGFAKVAVLETTLYMRNQLLRDIDWAGMAHSIEVRVPLVDTRLLRETARVLPASAKQIASKSILANSPRVPLPRIVSERPKTEFRTPLQRWLESDKRLKRWQQIPELALPECHWARRWAYQLAAA
jgi:asparagine synthase (glutamine-hydrolysing)